jgi:hypothetical protein
LAGAGATHNPKVAGSIPAGATDDEISETLMYAMRGRARAAWSVIKHIPDIEDLNKEWKTTFERENAK